MAIESPKYRTIHRDNKFEIREYGDYILAEVEDHFPMGKVNYYFRYYEHY